MSAPRSIAGGLLVRLLILFSLTPLLAGINIIVVGEQNSNPEVDARLERLADQIVPYIRFNPAGLPSLDVQSLRGRSFARDLRVAMFEHSAIPAVQWPSDLKLRAWDFFDGYQTVRAVNGHWLRLLFAPPAGSWSAWLHWYADELADEILPLLIALMCITLPLSAITIRRELAPVRRLAREAAAIEPGVRDTRLTEVGVPSELLPLVRAVNGGLERLDAGLAAQQRYSAVVAHELKTPLAALLLQLERDLPRAEADACRQQVLRMRRLVEQLLIIAELTAKRFGTADEVDLTAVAREAISQEVVAALDAQVELELQGPQTPVLIRGNAAAVAIAIGNLIDNAIRHSPKHERILVRVTPDRTVEVADRGAGVPAEERDIIFEPFWRNPGSKGAGLGLAIVRAMADLHGATVTLNANAPHGCVFLLRFPPPDIGHGQNVPAGRAA